eukprot:9406617-Pyramimonas_sp.AAC.1
MQPRSIDVISDLGLHMVAKLLTRCEDMCCLPDSRLQTRLVRLAKPNGGHRLIGLINTLVRIWGRLRRPLSKRWELQHPCDAFWGPRPGATSADAALQRNLDSALARLRGHAS